ncbi:MAG TPA: type II secretion system protein [Patescibacteria group bacterium]|nr:type II secretion system protein [Patescibacteria group bacterium]
MDSYRRTRGGYTILEVMIVLIVSTTIFASAMIAYSQQNRRARFTESVQTFAQNIQDVLNDIDTGYYASNNDFSCTAGLEGNPEFPTGGSARQGTNSGCVFVGKALQFTPQEEPMTFKTHTIVGRQFIENSTTDPVSTLDEALPVALPNNIDSYTLTADVRVIRVSSGGINGAGIAVVADSGSGGVGQSGHNARTQLALVPGSMNMFISQFANSLKLLNSGNIITSSDGIEICLQEEGGGRQAVVTLGADQSRIAIDVKVDQAC